VIIETTGLADPAPVCQTFFVEPSIQGLYKIDAVLTVCDSKHILQHLREKKPEGVENEAVEQVAFADKILLNKIDLVDEEQIQEVISEIKGINGYAKIIRTQFKDAPPDMVEIIGLAAFDLDRILEEEADFLQDEDHEHDQSVTSVGFQFGADQPINLAKLQNWINYLLREFANELFRYKGVISVRGDDRKFIFQGVHMVCDGDFAAEWGDSERKSIFCFIGKDLDKMDLKNGFEDCISTETLRFAVGDQVRANCGQWLEGTVVEQWAEGHPYKIQLRANEKFVMAPADNDETVRAGWD